MTHKCGVSTVLHACLTLPRMEFEILHVSVYSLEYASTSLTHAFTHSFIHSFIFHKIVHKRIFFQGQCTQACFVVQPCCTGLAVVMTPLCKAHHSIGAFVGFAEVCCGGLCREMLPLRW